MGTKNKTSQMPSNITPNIRCTQHWLALHPKSCEHTSEALVVSVKFNASHSSDAKSMHRSTANDGKKIGKYIHRKAAYIMQRNTSKTKGAYCIATHPPHR